MRKRTIKKRYSMRPMLVVFLGFTAVILLGALMLSLPVSNTDGKWLSFIDGLFTSASAVCVTGLTVRPTSLGFTVFGQVILLLLIQIGGLGIMTLATLIFMIIGKRITLKDRIALQEALGQDQMKGIVRLVRNIAIMTGVIESAGAILLIPFFCVKNGAVGIWQAIFVSVSAFCNAGFDILGTARAPYASLTEFSGNVGVLLIISALIILGGMGFTVIDDIIKNKFGYRRFNLHTKIVLIVTLVLIVFGTVFFMCSEYNSVAFTGLNFGEKLLNSFFQSVTARTAGFNTIEQNLLSQPGTIMTCILMFIGASPCGTGGGIKTTTFAVIVLMAYAGLRNVDEITLYKFNIKTKLGYRAVAITTLAVAILLIGTLIISATDSSVPINYLAFETISAFATVGLSMGICSTLSVAAKFVLAVIMLIGRLGPLSIGMIFNKKDTVNIKYPSGNIMIG